MKECLREPQLSTTDQQFGEQGFERFDVEFFGENEVSERAFEELFEDDLDMSENNSMISSFPVSDQHQEDEKGKQAIEEEELQEPLETRRHEEIVTQPKNNQIGLKTRLLYAQKAPRKSIKQFPQKAPRKSINCRGKPVKKPRKWKKGTVALREIKKYQKGVELLIPKANFVRLVREIANSKRQDDPLRFSAE